MKLDARFAVIFSAVIFIVLTILLCFSGQIHDLDYWDKSAKKATTPEEVFNASFHIHWYLTEDFERVGIDKSFHFLTNKMASPQPEVRDQAASCLRWLNHPPRNDILVAAYQREQVEDVKLGILYALANTNVTDNAVQFLKGLIADDKVPHRWSAVRSLSIMNPPGTDELLKSLTNHTDKRMAQEAVEILKYRAKELHFREGEGAVLLTLTQNIVNTNMADRVLSSIEVPGRVAGKPVRKAVIYDKVLLIHLDEHDGGIIINPVGKHELPAMAINGRLASPTAYPGIFEFTELGGW